MAVSPCPRCQSAETFHTMRQQNAAAFVVQKTPREDEGPEFFCTTKPTEHSWQGIDTLARELRKAGYR